jgi:hypothetical protein
MFHVQKQDTMHAPCHAEVASSTNVQHHEHTQGQLLNCKEMQPTCEHNQIH